MNPCSVCCGAVWAGTDSEETDRLENYVIARGVRGLSGWRREWKRPLKHMEEGDMETLNEIRARLAGWLETLKEGLTRKDGNVRGMTEALYDCLGGPGYSEKTERNRKRGLTERATWPLPESTHRSTGWSWICLTSWSCCWETAGSRWKNMPSCWTRGCRR